MKRQYRLSDNVSGAILNPMPRDTAMAELKFISSVWLDMMRKNRKLRSRAARDRGEYALAADIREEKPETVLWHDTLRLTSGDGTLLAKAEAILA